MEPIFGRYRPIRAFRGGMGIVYLAADLQEHKPVALKTFRPELLADVAARERFVAEARTWLALGSHPHVVPVHMVRSDERDQIFVIADYIAPIEGHPEPSLRSFVGRVSTTEALQLALGIARGMAHATARVPGLVHRDLKPENVLVGSDRRARVTDFGLAGLRDGAVAGTPRYMAPEQHQGRADQRSDIYAVGLILHELVGGEPHPIARIATAEDPAHRFQSWAELAQVLVDALGADAPPPVSAEVATRAQRVLEGWSQNALANALEELGQSRSAAQGLRAVVAGARAEQEPLLEAAALTNLCRALTGLGELDEAAQVVEQALAIKQALGDPRGIAITLGARGGLHQRRGAHEAALADITRAADMLRVAGHVAASLAMLADRVEPLISLGRLDEAIAAADELHRAFAQRGDRQREAGMLGSLGLLYRKQGRLDDALAASTRAVATFDAIGDIRGTAVELQIQGHTLRAMNRGPEAVDRYAQSLARAEHLGDRLLCGMNLYALAQLTKNGDATALEAAAHYEAAGRPDFAADARGLAARIRASRGTP